MNGENFNEWVGRAKNNEKRVTPPSKNKKPLNVLRNEPQKSRGAMVMEIADKLLPSLSRWFSGKYSDEGMLIQPAHVRGLAIDMAEGLLKKQETKQKASA